MSERLLSIFEEVLLSLEGNKDIFIFGAGTGAQFVKWYFEKKVLK